MGEGHDYITTMKITADSVKLLVGDYHGQLKLMLSRDREVVKDFGLAHREWIRRKMIR